MQYRLLSFLGFLYVGGSLFAAADYSMAPKKKSVPHQQDLYRVQEVFRADVAKTMAELNRVAKPIAHELSTKYPTPEKLITFLNNHEQLAVFAKKFSVDVTFIKNVGKRCYVQEMFKAPSNDASRFYKFIFGSQKGDIHALANLLRVQAMFAKQVETLRRHYMVLETMVGKFPEGVYHFISPSEYTDELMRGAKERSINPHFYFLTSEKEKASLLRVGPILSNHECSLAQKLESIEKLMKAGSPELVRLGNALALVKYDEHFFRLIDAPFMLMLEGLVGFHSLGIEEDLGSGLLPQQLHQLVKKLPLALPATPESYQIFRDLLKARVISSLLLLFRDRVQSQLAYDLQPLCEIVEEAVFEFHSLLDDEEQKNDIWYHVKKWMHNFSAESLQRRKQLLERMNRVLAGYEQRKNIYEQCYQKIVGKLIEDSSPQSDQDYLLACSLFENDEEWGTLPSSICSTPDPIPYFSGLAGDLDNDFMRSCVAQPSIDSNKKTKKKSPKKKQKNSGKKSQPKPSGKVSFVTPRDLAVASAAPTIARCPSPICGYCERITKWFNPEKVSDSSKESESLKASTLYHSFPLLADNWLIRHGKQSAWHGSQGVDTAYSLPGKIIFLDRTPQFVRFTCTLNKQNKCYHRGIIYTNWNAITDVEYKPEEIAAIQKECAEQGEFSVPKEQMKNYSLFGQIREQTEEYVKIQDLHNKVTIVLYLPQ